MIEQNQSMQDGRERKQKKHFPLILLVFVIFFLSFVVFLKNYLEWKQTRESSTVFSDVEAGFVQKPKIQEMFLTKNINSRPGLPLKEMKGVVVHYTANPGTDAKANRNYFESRKDMADKLVNKVSSHYIVGLTGNIIQCIPEKEIAYASNQRNEDTISIECCHPDNTGKFTEQTYQSLVHLVAYLVDAYGISTEQIIRHYDVTGKECPKYFVRHEGAWKRFKQEVQEYINQSKKI